MSRMPIVCVVPRALLGRAENDELLGAVDESGWRAWFIRAISHRNSLAYISLASALRAESALSTSTGT